VSQISAFTGQQVTRLTGLSQRVLRYWEETDVFRASYVDPRPRVPYRRIYTFRDVVSLRTLAELRRRYDVKLDDLRRTGRYLRDRYEAPWSELRFGITSGGRVVFWDKTANTWVTGHPPGQTVIPFDIEEVARTTEREASRLRERHPGDIGKVVRHRHVMSNAWRLAGTRIPTSAVWHFHEDGFDAVAIICAYPDLTEADVAAAIAHERQRHDPTAA
jgi:DNA-binding transcriptional MerR regulator/uncharacterized protein (DUF433 family)